MTITVSQLTEEDISSMYLTISENLGHIYELKEIQYLPYETFFNHFKNILDNNLLKIFAIRVNGLFAGAIEVATKDDRYIIGYWIGLAYRNRGIVTMAVEDVIKHDLAEKKPITANTRYDNLDSIRILQKLGFKETHRDSELIHYERVDRP